MTDTAVDVLVVGLGPAGSCAAEAAARRGLRVLAVDKRQHAGAPVQCAELVPRLLDQFLPDLTAVTAQTVRRMLTEIEALPADETAPFPGRMLDREAFDAWLVRRAQAAGADCAFGTGLAAVAWDGMCRVGARLVRPRVIIAADGPRSRVAAAIGRPNREFVETRQITVTLPAAHDATDIFLSRDYPGGYGWMFPKGGVGNLGVGVGAARRATLKSALGELHERLAAAGRVGCEISAITGGAIPVGGRQVPTGALNKVVVLLAGDAAGLTHPVSGAGIAAAVQSGMLAGTAAAAWLGGTMTAPADYAEELGDLFDGSLHRALRRRRDLAEAGARAETLRRAWIAYDEYWAELTP